jgi:PEP-CTERM motif
VFRASTSHRVRHEGTQTFRQFYTREEANSEFRPALVIDYTAASVPEPSTLTLLSIASVCMVGYARRKEYRGKR